MPRLYSLFLVLALQFLPAAAFAYENESVGVTGVRLQKTLGANTFATINLQGQFLDGFAAIDRHVLEGSVSHSRARHQFTGAWQVQVRHRQEGNEHRLWQQWRYRQPLGGTWVDWRSRLEERYFDHTGKAGARARLAFQWFRPLAAGYTLSLGNELVVNLNDVSAGIRRGFHQYRLLSGLRRDLDNGDQVDFNYQLRYIESPQDGPFLQHQVQLIFLRRL